MGHLTWNHQCDAVTTYPCCLGFCCSNYYILKCCSKKRCCWNHRNIAPTHFATEWLAPWLCEGPAHVQLVVLTVHHWIMCSFVFALQNATIFSGKSLQPTFGSRVKLGPKVIRNDCDNCRSSSVFPSMDLMATSASEWAQKSWWPNNQTKKLVYEKVVPNKISRRSGFCWEKRNSVASCLFSYSMNA